MVVMATNATRLFCAGFNLYGQIGQGCASLIESFIDFPHEKTTQIEIAHSFTIIWTPSKIDIQSSNPTPKIDCTSIQLITKVSCCDKRILILCASGRLFKIDLSDSGFLPLSPLPTFSLEDGDKIEQIACGSKISIAISQFGAIFNLPNKLETKLKVANVCCGREHCLILDTKGNVWTFGRGSRGQLAHENLEDLEEPKLIKALDGLKIIQISAGGYHSCALSESGDFYSWGWNGNGQLGYKEKTISVMATPKLVDLGDLDLNVCRISCGARHTIALLDNGQLWGCGWNKYFQLGINSEENCYGMRFLHNFADQNVVDVKCGPWCSLVLAKPNETLLTEMSRVQSE